MSNFERDMANTMLDAADARIASLEADKADLLRVLGVADEKIRSGEDARGQYIRENAALEARCREIEEALRDCYARWQWFIQPETPEPPVFDMERIRKLLTPAETAVEPCRIHEYDGAFKCLTHQKTWGAITNAGQPCEGFDEKQWYADRSLRLAPGWYCAKCGHLNESKDMSCFDCGGETATQANRGGVK